jgi:hypothetical protein
MRSIVWKLGACALVATATSIYLVHTFRADGTMAKRATKPEFVAAAPKGVGPGRGAARRLLQKQYPYAERDAGLEKEDIEMLAEMLGRNAWESEYVSRLGVDKYRRWKDYQISVNARQQVSEVRGKLEATANPLRDDQATILTAILQTEQRRRSDIIVQETYPTKDQIVALRLEEKILRISEETNMRIVNAASPHITEGQRTVFDSVLSTPIAALRNSLMTRRAGVQKSGAVD